MSTPTRETIADWIRMVNEEAHKPLTAWETNFMESITDQFERSGRLSAGQLATLERLYAEKTP